LTVATHVTLRATRDALVRPLLFVTLAEFVTVAIVTLALVDFAHPLLSPVMLHVVAHVGTPWARHYPGNLVELARMLGRLMGLTQWLVMPLLLGWVGTLVMYGQHGMSLGSALFTSLRRLPRLLAFGVPIVVAWGAAVATSQHALEMFHRAAISGAAH